MHVNLAMVVTLLITGCQAGHAPKEPLTATSAIESEIALPDVNGQQIQPLAMESGQRAAVLIFVATECPICNAYAGEISRLNDAYAVHGVQFFLIDVDTNLSAAEVARHAREYGLSPTVLLDPGHNLVRKFAATTTPEAVLIDRAGSISYHGRIDDLYIRLGQRRYEASEHDLRDAIDAVIAGRPAPIAVTRPVGCAI